DYQKALATNEVFFLRSYKSFDNIPAKSFPKPSGLSFLPTWVFAYNYPHNVNDEGVRIANCTNDKYCNHLPVPVFPTAFYETVVCLLLFALLWALRKRLKIPGELFAVYLMLNGIERFCIEKIRVNNRMNLFGFHPTQAEVISSLLVITGLILFILLRRRPVAQKT
ncbi:MAG TPA: prolipoprotein diacylglyceryl transferase family protein, partial [Chitinophagaceae bacterium]